MYVRHLGLTDYRSWAQIELELEPGRTELVPFTRAAVPAVDLAAGTVELVLP